ncbi:hypothetical protein SCA6_007787 [Theobroma cacao]
MKLISAALSFFTKMLVSLRSLFHINRRIPVCVRVSHPFPLFQNSRPLNFFPPSNNSIIVCPFILLTSFFYMMKFPFGTKCNSNTHIFLDDFNRESMCKIIQQDQWNDPKIVTLFDSSLAPIWVSKILVGLKQEPKLALKFFKWAKTHKGFGHTSESYCILVHILFYGRMYSDASAILKEFILLRQRVVLPGCDFFDVLWSARNVCRYGFGVFDALFSVLVDLGMLEEASQCFSKMKRYRVLPKVRSCNALLHRLSKTGRRDQSRRFFAEMIGVGVAPSEKSIKPDLLLYGTIIWGLCNQDKIEETKVVMSEMKESRLSSNPVIYTTVMDSYFKAGKIAEALNLLEEMSDLGIEVTVVTFCVLVDGLCKTGLVLEAINYFNRMSEFNLQPNVAAYTVLIDGLCKNNFIQAAKNMFDEMLSKNLVPDKTAYTALIDGNLKHGNFQEALNLQNEMIEMGIELDLPAYTSLVWGFCQCGQLQQARKFLDEMIRKHILPDEILCIGVLRKYYELGHVDEAIELQNEMAKTGLITSPIHYAVPSVQP